RRDTGPRPSPARGHRCAAGACRRSSAAAAPRRPPRSAPLCRRSGDGIDDLIVADAATEIAGNGLADVVLRWMRGGVKQCLCGKHEAGRAKAALGAAAVNERLLDRVQVRAAPETLDGQDVVTGSLLREDQVGIDRPAVDKHRAGAAVAVAAALLGA